MPGIAPIKATEVQVKSPASRETEAADRPGGPPGVGSSCPKPSGWAGQPT